MKNLLNIISLSKKHILVILCMGFLFALGACTDLTEDAYSEITKDSFVPSESDAVALMASGYTPLRYIMGWQGLFDLQEEPADIFVTPTRPNGWDDGGTYKRMHFHTWDNTQWQPRNTWITCYSGINNINRVILQIQTGEVPVSEELSASIIAEMRALRSLWYSILLDTHGNVPIVASYSDEIPTQNTRSEVYQFIIDELTEVMPLLSEDVDNSTYGRMTKWGALHLLARVYLNAEVYTGTAQWAKCLEACNQIIASGKYSLDSNYKDIFKEYNENSPEIIFAVPYDEVYGPQWNAHMKMLTPGHQKVFNMSSQPWGGSSCNPQFIDSYDPDDKRLADSWLFGDQINANDGSVVMTMTNEMPSIYFCEFEQGYRSNKYGVAQGSKSVLNNDLPYFRYTDVLMMKAECLLRTGSPDEAAAIVTEVRTRSFDDIAKATVTGAELMGDTTVQYGTLAEDGTIGAPGDQTPVLYGRFLDELGWEFAAEFRRRTDMIRFGVYQTKSWYNHTPQGSYTTLFPIGLEELNTNSNLTQNPGY